MGGSIGVVDVGRGYWRLGTFDIDLISTQSSSASEAYKPHHIISFNRKTYEHRQDIPKSHHNIQCKTKGIRTSKSPRSPKFNSITKLNRRSSIFPEDQNTHEKNTYIPFPPAHFLKFHYSTTPVSLFTSACKSKKHHCTFDRPISTPSSLTLKPHVPKRSSPRHHSLLWH